MIVRTEDMPAKAEFAERLVSFLERAIRAGAITPTQNEMAKSLVLEYRNKFNVHIKGNKVFVEGQSFADNPSDTAKELIGQLVVAQIIGGTNK